LRLGAANLRKSCYFRARFSKTFALRGRTSVTTMRCMPKRIPTIQTFMSVAPHTIGVEQTLAHAASVMREHGIRHLPVLSGGALVGMLTERDVALVETLAGVDPKVVTTADAMSTEVYKVSPESALDEVVREMASRKYGSAVVVSNHKVVGVFTTVDVCRALAELLSTRLA
jgi:acetoin utilization protein AcuB